MQIRFADVLKSLETVASRFNKIHESGNLSVLSKAESMLRETKDQFDEGRRQQRIERPVRPWGFSIDPDNPLRFKKTEVEGHEYYVDLFLKTYWIDDPANKPHELNVAVRVWSMDPSIYFRREWDAKRLQNDIEPEAGRVVLRIHFDLANKGQQGPLYHLQVGGRQHEGDLSWFPSAISVPRLHHMPMDLVLATEMIAATFYEDAYRANRRDPSWKSALRTSQGHLLSGYFQSATKAVDDEKSVLEELWNVGWE